MQRFISLALTLALIAAASCSRTELLANSHRSAESLATAVLDALGRNDRAQLDRLALNEQEFRDRVWPDLPAARPERNLPFSYVWGDLHQKSDLALSETMKQYGGRRIVLRGVTFSGETPYASYRVHRDATFHVTDDAGVERSLRVCGSLLNANGDWKVFSYVTSN